MNLTNLVFEGGGVLGIAYVGGIKILEEKGILQSIKNFAGTSSGSMIASLLACKCDINRLESIIRNLDFKRFKDDSFIIIEDIYRFVTEYGWYKGEEFQRIFEDTLEEITGSKNITFQEVYDRYGNELVLVGTNISRKEATYFSRKLYPNMKISDAVRISISIPLFFKSVKFQNIKDEKMDVYVDGGILDNYPIWVFDNDRPNQQTLGFKLLSTDGIKEKIIGKPDYKPIDNIMDYMSSLVDTIMYNANRLHIKSDYWDRTVPIPIGTISSVNFDLTDEDKDFLINSGKLATITFFEKKMHVETI
jgi:NTE family protein